MRVIVAKALSGICALALPVVAVETGCEVCALDEHGRPSFGLMQRGGGTLVIELFDLLELDGESLVDLPLSERRSRLSALVDKRSSVVRLSESFEDGKGLFAAAKKEGKVVVYNMTLGAPYFKDVMKSFETKYGIPVESLDLRASELAERIRTEQAAGRYLGDVEMISSTMIEDELPETIASVNDEGDVRALADVEEELIRFALKFYRGQMSQVARKLGIGRSTLYRKLKDYDIDPDDPLKHVA